MSDYFFIQFSPSEQSGRTLLSQAQSLYGVSDHLQSAMAQLHNSGLQGLFVQELNGRYQRLQQVLKYVADECEEAGHDLLIVVERARQVDADARSLFIDWGGFFPSGFMREISRYSFFAAQLPALLDLSFIQERIKDDYTFRQVATDFVVEELSEEFFKHFMIKLAGQAAAMSQTQEQFLKVLDVVKNPWFARTTLVGASAFAGVVEWAMDDDRSIDTLRDQVVSGAIQGLIGLTPVGRVVMIADAATQLIGRGASEFIENNAMWLANGDAARADQIQITADRFQDCLEAADLDARIDGAVGAAFRGDWQGLGEEVVTGLWGIGGIVVEGAGLAAYTVDGVAQQIAANTQIDETLQEVAKGVEQGVGDVLNFFGINL